MSRFTMQDGDQKVMKCVRGTVTFGNATTTLGKIPSGARIERVTVGVRTAFDGTSASMDVGISTDTDKYMATGKITEATIGTYTYCPGVTLTADETAIVSLSDGSGSAGDASVLVEFSV